MPRDTLRSWLIHGSQTSASITNSAWSFSWQTTTQHCKITSCFLLDRKATVRFTEPSWTSLSSLRIFEQFFRDLLIGCGGRKALPRCSFVLCPASSIFLIAQSVLQLPDPFLKPWFMLTGLSFSLCLFPYVRAEGKLSLKEKCHFTVCFKLVMVVDLKENPV